MVKIEILFKEGKISRINELELNRYINFFEKSYLDNLGHSKANITAFPRWSIISGYYAMHDITKLLLAKKFRIKIEFEVHATTIKVLDELIKNKEILKLIQEGYKEFISLANDLAEAKEDRVKVQYYTGTDFMKEEYIKRAKEFLNNIVLPYLEKMIGLIK
ncbi:MAG: hypothetical protein AB1571_01400 [Nanoarchaeota archaeon]